MSVDNSCYLEYAYQGIKETQFFQKIKIQLLSERFSFIEFSTSDTIKFYFKEDFNSSFDEISSYTEECRSIFFKLYLKMKKEGTYLTDKFYFSPEPIKYEIILGSKMYVESRDEIAVLDGVDVFRFDEQGNPINEQDFLLQQIEIYSHKLQCLLDENLMLEQEHETALQIFMTIEHAVLRFTMMYSYLYELCDANQEKTSKYIKSSTVFKQLPIPSIRQRKTTKGQLKEEDVFTYYRNIVGHSYHEILAFSEQNAVCEIEILNDYLLRILLEKMEGLI